MPWAVVVGTVNLDNRSFNLSFEISVLVVDHGFSGEIAKMLENDFEQCSEDSIDSFERYSLSRQLLSKFARLFSPVL